MKSTSDRTDPNEPRPASKITGEQPLEEFIAQKSVPSASTTSGDQTHGDEVERAREHHAQQERQDRP